MQQTPLIVAAALLATVAEVAFAIYGRRALAVAAAAVAGIGYRVS